MSEKQMCCAKVVSDSTGFRTFYKPCSKAAKVDRDGKWYCGTHDPVAIKQKCEAQSAKRNAQREAELKKYADQALGVKVLAWMRENEPEKLAEICAKFDP